MQKSVGFAECEEPFDSLTQNITEGTLRKVRDHDQPTGHYRGAAHSKRNMNVIQNQSRFVFIFFHNFSG